MAICPKCERTLTQLTVENMPLKAPRVTWPGVTLVCPYCSACLGASVDPIKFGDQLLGAIRKGKTRLL
jgi:hypothetical protein